MPEEYITIELEGSEQDGGDVRLGDFIEELSALRTALRRTQQVVTKDNDPVSYRVAALSHSSPSRVTVAIVPRTPIHAEIPRKISRRFTSALRMVRRNHRYARGLDPEMLDSFKGLTSPLNKKLHTVKVYRDKEPEVRIDREFTRHLEQITMTEESERDEIVGRLEQLNIHNKAQFHIYPVVGPQKILCQAPMSLRDKVSAFAGKRVAVDGWAHYRKDAPFPHAMKVIDIEPIPQDEELASLSDLQGLAPNATGGINPEDFVRELRRANW
jgi:hypothetical protein